jgi:hypothetical protein
VCRVRSLQCEMVAIFLGFVELLDETSIHPFGWIASICVTLYRNLIGPAIRTIPTRLANFTLSGTYLRALSNNSNYVRYEIQ